MNFNSMKRNPVTQLFLASLMLAVSVCTTRADLAALTQTFDDNSTFSFVQTAQANYNPPPETIRPDWTNAFTGIAATNVVWSATNNTPLLTSGSMRFDFVGISSTTNTSTNLSAAAWTMDLFATAPTNRVTAVSFDIMVDKSSITDSSGGFGNFVVVLRDDGYSFPTNNNVFTNFSIELGNPNFSTSNNLAGTWEHILINGTNGLPSAAQPTSGNTNTVRAVTFQWFFTGHNLNGNVTCYVDNLVIWTNGTIAQPTMTISNYTGPKGILNVATTPNSTVDQAIYERQVLRTVGRTYSWIGSASTINSGGTGPTNTYALTITNFPPPANSNFQAHIWVATGTPVEANADWVESNCFRMIIQNNADGTASGTVSWKVYDANDGNMYNGGAGDVNGTLGTVTNPSPLGTWSFTIDHDVNVTITAPGGNTVTTNIPYNSDDLPAIGTFYGIIGAGAAIFRNPATVYIGCLPNNTNNIGQKATFSNFQITSNGVTIFSDNFSGNSLDKTKWVIAAEDPSGISQIPGNAAFLLGWTLPDAGFVLGAKTNSLNTGVWAGTSIIPFSSNGKRAAFAPGGGATFYRLQYILTE